MSRERRIGRPVGLAAPLSKATRAALRRHGFAAGDILSHWREIVGDTLAAQTCPEKLSFAAAEGGGTLRVRVDGPLGIELQHLAPLVIERINTYYGHRAVARMKLVQGPVAPPASPPPPPRLRPLSPSEERTLDGCVEATADPELREALRALGRRVLADWPEEPEDHETSGARE